MTNSAQPTGLSNISLALVHYPVVDKNGDTITTSVTNLDVHDIARTCRTFGVRKYYLVTPVDSQVYLINKIMDHWKKGWGAGYNPRRSDALHLVERVNTLDDLQAAVEKDVASDDSKKTTPAIQWVATSARPPEGVPQLPLDQLANHDGHTILLFGTGWGLHPDVYQRCDAVLPPITGPTEYNHLAVRSAVAIYLANIFKITP
jgi:tRNA (guanine37-N1)-methyltransferase